MSSTLILMIVLVVVVALGVAGWYLFRGRSLRRRFGPEYVRLAADNGRAGAERELRERVRRHDALDLAEPSAAQRERYIGRWRALQIHFVDAPAEAVREADALTSALIAEIGYPTEDFDDQLVHLSVEHARSLPAYREAHDLSRLLGDGGEATTEQLRRAMVHYRAMVADLLGPGAELDEPEPRRHSHAS